ncbi:C-C motif chemokine 4-like [Spea bombifrons]|uniref:C-C motif chemokine 4-like n=1 Tax=Spea bombifrons TaxID=233779 RepID=UPI002348F8C4|nr:C-C motif chemokine 4-like [Spea bombifrons]
MCSKNTLLLVALLIASAILTANCDIGKSVNCCTKVSSAKPKVAIEDYFIQKQDLPCVEAVVFVSQQGTIHCCRPNLPWVNKKIKEIRKKKGELQNEN